VRAQCSSVTPESTSCEWSDLGRARAYLIGAAPYPPAAASVPPSILSVTSQAMARAVGINHVALEVGDLDAALEWYGRFFELTLRGRAPGMTFVDLGDQFLALSEGRSQGADGARHFGLVVDDKEGLRAALAAAGVRVGRRGNLRFADPWGNNVEIVDYRDIQFTKAPAVLAGMGLDGLDKTDAARDELRAKGLD